MDTIVVLMLSEGHQTKCYSHSTALNVCLQPGSGNVLFSTEMQVT